MVNRTQRHSLDELAREQSITPWDGDQMEGFGLTEALGDDDFAAFLSATLSSRNDG